MEEETGVQSPLPFSPKDDKLYHSLSRIHRQITRNLDTILSVTIGFHAGIPASVLGMSYDKVVLNPRIKQLIEEDFVENNSSMTGVVDAIKARQEKEKKSESGPWRLNNRWYTSRTWKGQRGYVEIWQNEETEEVQWCFFREDIQERIEFMFSTIEHHSKFGSVGAERKARANLRKHLSPRQKDSYNLSDSFYERGKSGVLYLLRKNRPTLAMRLESHDSTKVRPLCTLCLHPIGYYQDSFAGMMAPSDEVLAHLLMIRADEHFYWRKANQNPINRANSGL